MSFIEIIISLIFIMIITSIILTFQFLNDKLNKIKLVSEISDIKKSLLIFNQIYNFMPGDYPYAKKTLSSNYNGNGDNIIDDNYESLFVFEHMQKSNLFGKQNFHYKYSSYAKINYNMLGSIYSKCGYQIFTDSKLNNINYNLREKSYYIRIANDKKKGNLTIPCANNYIAKYIDAKLDDAKPLEGNFLADDKYAIGLSKKDKCICEEKENIVNYCIFNYNENCIMQLKIF